MVKKPTNIHDVMVAKSLKVRVEELEVVPYKWGLEELKRKEDGIILKRKAKLLQ